MSDPGNESRGPSEGASTAARLEGALARHAHLVRHVFDALLVADQMLDDDDLVEALDQALDLIVVRVADLESRGAVLRPECWEARLLRDLRGEAA